MLSAGQVVRDFCAAASTRDPAVLRACFSDDVVYHNIPMDPAEGIDATMAVIEMSGRYTVEAAYLEIPDTAYIILVRLTPSTQSAS